MTGASIVASPDPVFNPPKHSSPITGNMNTAQAHTTPRARTSTKSSNSTTPSVSSGRRGSSTGQMQRKKCNMRTIIVNCNSIAGKKKAEIAHLLDYIAPDAAIFTETKLL